MFGALAVLAGTLAIGMQTAGAVHDAGAIELDTGTAGANLVDSSPGSDPRDWASIFDSSSNEVPANFPAGTIDVGFSRDFVPGASGPDNSYYLPSSKDDQAINVNGGSSVWGCTSASNPTDKNDILNAYSAAVVAQSGPDAGDTIIYTGGERYANDGTAFWGVWFFQANNGCNAANGNAKFGSTKTDGDVLLLVNFDNGGAAVTIDAFNWHPCNVSYDSDGDGTKDTPSPIAASKCKDATLAAGYFTPALSGAVGGDCAAAAASDEVCATVNRQSITTPWPTQDKTSAANTLAVSEFFESGFNVTDAFNVQQGSEPCFSSFLLETRSSSSLDATLKDFAAGSLQTCGSVTAHKYLDKNADGTEDLPEDVGLQGWTMFIDKDADQTLDTGEVSGTTNSSGDVTFSNVKAGNISVCEVLTTGWVNSDPGQGTVADPDGTSLCKPATITVGGSNTVKLGNWQPGTISGKKFQDADGDGVQDTGEAAIAGVYIHLFGTNGYGGSVHLHTQTAANGTYSFASLQPGSYTLCESVPTGFTQTWPTSGPSCSTHLHDPEPPPDGSGFGISVTLDSNENDINNNFGNVSLHKVIVIVCHEGSDEIVDGSVSWEGGTAVATVPSTNSDDLCDLPAVATGQQHGDYDASVTIPSSGTGSGH